MIHTIKSTYLRIHYLNLVVCHKMLLVILQLLNLIFKTAALKLINIFTRNQNRWKITTMNNSILPRSKISNHWIQSNKLVKNVGRISAIRVTQEVGSPMEVTQVLMVKAVRAACRRCRCRVSKTAKEAVWGKIE